VIRTGEKTVIAGSALYRCRPGKAVFVIRSFSSHARHNAIAYLALFVALGGTSYAAIKLPANSVGTKQIKKGAVTSAKIKNGSITTADLAAGTLKAGGVGPAGPAGPKGETGAAGAKGETGPAGAPGIARAYAVVKTDVTFDAARTKNFTAVSRLSTGLYCLTPAAGIDPSTLSAVVSPEWGGSLGADLQAYVYANAPECAGQFEGITVNNGVASNNTAFSIIVP
jgi:hypothetical protein